jgi:hypothetical protein
MILHRRDSRYSHAITPFDDALGRPEVWLRGQSVAGVPALLQPVAHRLLQCREELTAALESLTPDQIWTRPADAASIGFHAARGGIARSSAHLRTRRSGVMAIGNGSAETGRKRP